MADLTKVLKQHFDCFAAARLRAIKSGGGTSLIQTKLEFEKYLQNVNAPVVGLSNAQMGRLMAPTFIRRKTNKGAFYLVAVTTFT